MVEHRELVGIQMLRGMCATAVVITHTAGMLAAPKYGGVELAGGALEYGFLGVDIFFVISAFIMSIVVLDEKLRPRISAADFFRKRFVRIVPLMWVAILSYAAMQAAFVGITDDWAGYARAMLLWPSSFLKPDVIWTLRQEFIFYTLFALAFFGPRPLRWLLPLWVLAPFAYVATLGSWSTPTAFIDTTASILFSATNIEFGAGLIIGLLFAKRGQSVQVRLALHPFAVVALLMGLSFLLCWALDLAGQTLAITLLMGACGAAIVAVAASAACPPGWLSRFGKLLGDASYSIYLFHSHVLAVLLAVRMRLSIELPTVLLLVLVTTAAVVAGIVISIWIERPLVRFARTICERPRALAVPA